MKVAVVLGREIDDWSGQGQSFRRFESLVAPLLPHNFQFVQYVTEALECDRFVFWDMQEFCSLILDSGDDIAYKSIVRIGGMQLPDLWPELPLPARLTPLHLAGARVASGYTLARQLSTIIDEHVYGVPHSVDLESFRPAFNRGSQIVAVANDVDYYRVSRLEATGLPIRFVGRFLDGKGEHIAPVDMPAVYRDASVFVRVTSQEAGCLSRAEALACGVPQVASNVGDAIFQVDGNGYVLAQASCDCPKTLRNAILRIVESSDEEWFRMSDRSRELSQQYAPQRAADVWGKALV